MRTRGQLLIILQTDQGKLNGDDESNLLPLDESLLQMERKERGLYKPTSAGASFVLKMAQDL